MRLRIFSLCVLLVLIAMSQAAASEDPRGKVVRAPDMPRVAQNQTRPHFRVGALCEDCGEPLVEEPGFTIGACNCSRNCSEGYCRLAPRVNGCKSDVYGPGCTDCTDCQ